MGTEHRVIRAAGGEFVRLLDEAAGEGFEVTHFAAHPGDPVQVALMVRRRPGPRVEKRGA